MRRTSTLILLFLVLGLALFIWLRERHEMSTEEERQTLEQVMRFDPDRAVALRWTYRDESLEARQRDGQWWLREPLLDRANPELIDRILEQAADLNILATMDEGELRESDSGLGSRAIGLAIDLEDDTALQVDVGRAGPFTNSNYLRFDPHGDGQPIIALADGDLRDLLRSPVDDWRDPMLLDFTPADVVELRLRTPGGEIVARRPPDDEEAMWQLERPLQTRGHRSRIDDLLALLGNLTIRGVEEGSNGQPGGSAEEGFEVQLGLADERSIGLWIGGSDSAPDGRVLARTDDRPFDFYLDDPILRLATLRPNDLRDDQLANIDPQVIQSVRIEGPTEAPVELARRGENWWLVAGDTALQANADRVNKLIEEMNRQPIVEFASDTAADVSQYGLDEPLRTVTLSTRPWTPEDDEPTVGPTGSADTVRLRIGQAEDYRLYAKYDDEPFVYGITAEILNAMPPQRTRWRSLQLMRFSLFHLESVRIRQGLQPPLQLSYQADSYQWKARYADQNVSFLLDRQRVDLLAATLATFQVTDWLTDRRTAYSALASPSLRIQLDTHSGIDPETGEATATERTELIFAPSAADRPAAPYYGRINEHPDVFLIPAELYARLATPPFDPERLRQFQQGNLPDEITEPDLSEQELPSLQPPADGGDPTGQDSSPDVPAPPLEVPRPE